MKKHITYILITYVLLLSTFSARAQKLDTAAIISYIKLYKDIAVSEMHRTGVPASITLAQGIHESGFGNSYLAQNTNNHFGIKCKEEWKGKTFKYTDDAPNECFRVYDNVEDSYKDHSDFLKNRPRYASLFLLDKYDYKGWAYGLKKAGYATNPKYPEILIKTIEGFQLTAFDKDQIPSYISPLQKTIVVEKDEDAFYNVTDSMEVEVKKTLVKETLANDESNLPKTVNTSIKNESVQPTVPTKKITKNIFRVNDCKAVKLYIAKGETLDLIANILKIEKQNLLAYNDITDETVLKDGQTIFIQQKKKSNKEGNYKVKPEDNIWSISQKKGIRLASLLKMNKMETGEEPAAKETLVLKGKAKEKPAIRSTMQTQPAKQITAQSAPNKKIISDTIVRAKDTIYPSLDEKTVTALSVDSNKILGWESESKLLEKTTIAVAPVKESIKAEPITNSEPTVNTAVSGKDNPTVYPKVIDYNKLPKSTNGSHLVVKGDTMYNICKRYNISIPQLMEWNNLTEQSVKLGQVLKIQQH